MESLRAFIFASLVGVAFSAFKTSQPTFLIVGSSNIDIILPPQLSSDPEIGSSGVIFPDNLIHSVIIKGKVDIKAGGKGLNQALSVKQYASTESAVAFVTCLPTPSPLTSYLHPYLDALTTTIIPPGGDSLPGLGLVFPRTDGDVRSIVALGANDDWPEGWDIDLERMVGSASVVLLQHEVPPAVNHAVLSASTGKDITVIMDLGGCGDTCVPDDVGEGTITYLTGNKAEWESLVGGGNIVACVTEYLQTHSTVLKAIVTLGSDGTLLITRASDVHVPAVPCDPKDSTGAGDCFRGAFAACLAEGKEERECVEFANAAAGISTETIGAGQPGRDVVEGRMRGLGVRGGGGKGDFRGGFGSRLNSMKDRRDLTDHPDDVVGWIRRMGESEGVDLLDFNSPQHLNEHTGLEVIKGEMDKAGLKAGAICLRYPKQMVRGALTNPDEGIRREAIRLTKDACRIAKELGCNEVVVWSAYDGYDYSFGADYGVLHDRVVEGFREVCDEHEDVKVSLEYKPTDEHTRFFAIPTTGHALLLCRDVDRPNFGLTLDFGHCLMAGENPAQSAAMAAREGRLFGVQLNDGYTRLAAEDGMMFGSVHPLMALEFVHILRTTRYEGHVYFDTFPRNEDPVKEAERNVKVFKRFWKWAGDIEKKGIGKATDNMDAMEVLRVVDKVMFKN